MYSEDLLQEVEEFAYAYMSREEIAAITEIKVEELKDQTTDPGKVFLKGRLKRKAKFNLVVIALSDQLSSPAMAIELKLAEKSLIDDL